MRIFTWCLVMWSLTVTAAIRRCGPDVCFNWKVSDSKLTLVCKIPNFILKAYIEDPKGKIQADCLPPSKTIICNPRYDNGTIKFNSTTNELTFTVKGDINKHINGNWTCRHGSNKDIARVEVTVFEYKGSKFSDDKGKTLFEGQCTDTILCISALSFIAVVILALVVLSFRPRRPFEKDDRLRRRRSIIWMCKKRSEKCVKRMKNCVFATSTIICFGIVYIIGSHDYLDCSSGAAKWPFIVFGLLFGFLFCLMFLQNDKQVKEYHYASSSGENDSQQTETTV